MPKLDSKNRVAGTIILHVNHDEALTIMDALANQVTIQNSWPGDDWINAEEAADAYDTYQEIGRQLHNQNWGNDA